MRTSCIIAAALVFGITTVIADPVDPVAIVAAHNQWRTEVGLGGVRWSAALAQRAEQWAAELQARNSCQMKHSGPGENLYQAGPLRTANAKDADGNWLWESSLQPVSEADVVGSWGSEKQWYDHSSNTCGAPAGQACGHYTQIVWHNSLDIGCAKATCEDFSQVWVCNYAPAGNVAGEKPY